MADLDDIMGGPDADKGAPEGESNEEKKASPLDFLKKIKIPPSLLKWGIRVSVVLVVIAIQAAASFFVVTKVIAPFDPEEAIQTEDVIADSLAGTTAALQTHDEDVLNQTDPETHDETLADISTIPEPDMNQSNVPPKVVGSIFTLGDVVVNPAMSQGRRFFIVTAVMIFEEKKIDEIATEREPILRDGYIRIMSRKSTRWLSSYSNQDILKKELMAYTKQVLEYPGDFYMAFTKYVLQ